MEMWKPGGVLEDAQRKRSESWEMQDKAQETEDEERDTRERDEEKRGGENTLPVSQGNKLRYKYEGMWERPGGR